MMFCCAIKKTEIRITINENAYKRFAQYYGTCSRIRHFNGNEQL